MWSSSLEQKLTANEAPTTLNDAINSRFIQSVAGEDTHDQILNKAYKDSTMENPNLQKIRDSTAICIALKKVILKDQIEQRKHHQLVTNTSELKNLISQIQSAYVKKTIGAQLAEQTAIIDKQKTCDYNERALVKSARIKYTEAEKHNTEEKRKTQALLRMTLKEQMEWHHQTEIRRKLSIIADKKRMDEFGRETERLKNLETQKKWQKRDEFIQGVEDLKRMQQKLKCDRGNTEEAEAEAGRRWEAELEARKRKLKDDRIAKLRREQEVSQRIGKYVLGLKEKKDKTATDLEDLLIDERCFNEVLKDRQILERMKNERESIRHQMHLDAEEKRRRAVLEDLEKANIKQEMRHLAEEHGEHGRMMAEKRLNKMLTTRDALRGAVDGKKRFRVETKTTSIRLHRKQLEEEANHERRIQNTRKIILEQHAPKIGEFLGKNIL